jgi:hypothetical protein
VRLRAAERAGRTEAIAGRRGSGAAQDPELEQEGRIKLEREQAEAQKLGLELQLMALEVQRRQALLAAGTLAPFEPQPPATTVVA